MGGLILSRSSDRVSPWLNPFASAVGVVCSPPASAAQPGGWTEHERSTTSVRDQSVIGGEVSMKGSGLVNPDRSQCVMRRPTTRPRCWKCRRRTGRNAGPTGRCPAGDGCSLGRRTGSPPTRASGSCSVWWKARSSVWSASPGADHAHPQRRKPSTSAISMYASGIAAEGLGRALVDAAAAWAQEKESEHLLRHRLGECPRRGTTSSPGSDSPQVARSCGQPQSLPSG